MHGRIFVNIFYMLNTVICQEFCQSVSVCGFSSKCIDLGLKISSHCVSLDPLSSCKHVLQSLIGISDLHIDQVIDVLMRSNTSNLQKEYGVHKRWISQGLCPNLALLSKISIDQEMDIFVVCGDLPLKSYHKGQQLLRFSSNDESLLTNIEKDIFRRSSYKIIIGLGGIGIYHPIDQPNDDDVLLWGSLYDQAIFFNNSDATEETDIGLVAIPIENTDQNDNFEDTEVSFQDVERNFDGIRNDPNNSKSIKEFVRNYSIKSNNNIKILPSAYTCSDKIEMSLSHEEALSDGDGLCLNQSYDIDGFFAFADSNLMSKAFLAGTSITPNFGFCDKRTIKNIKTSYSHSGIRLLNSTHITKIATTEHNVVKFEMFLVAQATLGERPVACDWEKVLIHAMEESRISPCYNDLNGTVIHSGCTSQGLRDSMNSSRIASTKNIKNKTYCEKYSNETFNCFLFHLERIAKEKVQELGITVSRFDIFIRAIGMKFLYAYDDFSDIWKAINQIKEVIDINILPQTQVFLDFCVVSTPESNNEDVKVIIFCV